MRYRWSGTGTCPDRIRDQGKAYFALHSVSHHSAHSKGVYFKLQSDIIFVSMPLPPSPLPLIFSALPTDSANHLRPSSPRSRISHARLLRSPLPSTFLCPRHRSQQHCTQQLFDHRRTRDRNPHSFSSSLTPHSVHTSTHNLLDINCHHPLSSCHQPNLPTRVRRFFPRSTLATPFLTRLIRSATYA